MPWVAARIVAVLVAVLASVRALSEDAKPVEKVIALLEDLKDQVEEDGKQEAEAYDKFSSFCKASTKSKSDAITKGEDKTDDLSGTIEAKTAERKDKKGLILQRLKKQESLSSDLDDTRTTCQKDKNIYNEESAELTKALEGIRAAQKSLRLAKNGASSLLAIRSSYRDVSRALEFVQKSVRRDDAALLRQHLTVDDPEDAEYKWHSGGIDHILATLEDKYKNHKEEIDAEWTKTETSCEQTKATLRKDIDTNKDSVTKLKETVDSLSEDIAKAKDDLVSEQTALDDAKDYLKDLISKCEARAKDWDQRKAARTEEAEALSKAMQILRGQVKAADEAANKRALLLTSSKRKDAPAQVHQATPAQATSQLDEPAGEAATDVTAWLHGGAASFLQVVKSEDSGATEHQSATRQREWLLHFVQKESRRLSSTALSSLAVRVAGDPFDKVKGLLQQLIERLLDESAGEATKKGFCDEQAGKAEQERAYNFQEAQKLSADISSLKAQKEDLDNEADELHDRTFELMNERTEAKSTREEEKKANDETLQRANEGLESVTIAYNILKDFYFQAAPHQASSKSSAVALVQSSPVDEDMPETPEGEYKGMQDASKAIMGLLEVIVSDFDRTLEKTQAAETKSAADFVALTQKLDVDIAAQVTKRQLDIQDSKTIDTKIKKKLKDMQLAMDVVDSTLKRLEELQDMCMGHGRMSFEERTKKREAEIASLKEALCKLDADGVESDCA